MTTPTPAELNWRARARQWEERSKANLAEVEKLRAELAHEVERGRSWRSAYHSLRMSLEGRLDRIVELLEDTEWEETE